MRNSVTRAALAGFGQVLPGLMREFSGRVSWTIAAHPSPERIPAMRTRGASINPRLRLDVADFVAHRIRVHRPVVDHDRLLVRVDPRERVLHPVGVVSVGIVLARM